MLQFYILRKLIEHELGEQKVGEDDCYICSLSSRILVYKGQLTPGQVTAAVIEGLVVDSIDYFTQVPTYQLSFAVHIVLQACQRPYTLQMPNQLYVAAVRNGHTAAECICM